MVTKHGYQAFHAKIDIAAVADTTIVAAVAGMSIRIVNFWVKSAGTNAMTVQSAATTDLFGPVALTAQEGFVLGESEHGWQATNAGEALTINTTKAVQLSGSVTYFLV